MAVRAGADVAPRVDGRLAEGTDRPAGGDDLGDLAAEDAALAAAEVAAEEGPPLAAGVAGEGLNCEEALVLDVAERELRSEEHTSELQSQSNLVCRLLLE